MTVFFVVTTILGIALTTYFGIKSVRLERTKKSLDWADLQAAASDLGAEVRRFHPEVIFSPGLRGATFANLLLDASGEVPVFVGVSTWKESAVGIKQIAGYVAIETKKWFVHVPEALFTVANQRLLVVDDFAMSGDFLEKLRELCISRGFKPESIKTLAIVTTKVAKDNHKAPDYCWMQTPDSSFYFPWGKAR